VIHVLALLSAAVTGFVVFTKLKGVLPFISYFIGAIAAFLVFTYIKKLLNHYRP